MIEILIPTYGRADRLDKVAANVYQNTTTEFRLNFVVEASDQASIDRCRDIGIRAIINQGKPSYAGAANTGYRSTDGEYIFAGADDLNFHPGWDEQALRMFDGWAQVIGTNDLLNVFVRQGMHATHYMIERAYLDDRGGTIDGGPGSFLHEGYSHQYTDTEFIGIAKARVKFRPCFKSIVEHVHAYSPNNSVEPDDTTAKAFAHAEEDSQEYDRRLPSWQALSR